MLLASVFALTLLARRLNIAYPVVLVAGGVALGFVPAVPKISLSPDVVFLLFLPPILYWEALTASPRELVARSVSIAFLSTGLVIATIAVVAAVVHALVPQLSWPIAIAFGAIVAPTDALAVAAIAERLPFPRTLLGALQGESLFNDASSLVVFAIAEKLIVSGRLPTPLDVVGQAIWTSVGGVAAGCLIAAIVVAVRKRLNDPVLENVLSLATAFVSYFAADLVHASGILAVVTSGLIIGRFAPHIVEPETRLLSVNFWEVIVFILNGSLFMLVGLELDTILRDSGTTSAGHLLLTIGAVWLALVVVRALFAFPSSYAARIIGRRLRVTTDGRPSWKPVTVLAWAGMRVGISVATALSLPIEAANHPFVQRGLLIAIAYGTVLATLLVQGLSLPFVVNRLLDGAEPEIEREILRARAVLARSALDEIARREEQSGVSHDLIASLRVRYRDQVGRSRISDSPEEDERRDSAREAYESLRHAILQRQRDELNGLRDRSELSDPEYRDLLRGLDLESARLPLG